MRRFLPLALLALAALACNTLLPPRPNVEWDASYPLVQEGEDYYQITAQVPGLSTGIPEE